MIKIFHRGIFQGNLFSLSHSISLCLIKTVSPIKAGELWATILVGASASYPHVWTLRLSIEGCTGPRALIGERKPLPRPFYPCMSIGLFFLVPDASFPLVHIFARTKDRPKPRLSADDVSISASKQPMLI